MPAIPLPEDPSLELLTNQAELVRHLVHSGDEGALNLVDEFHPGGDRQPVGTTADTFTLADAQVTVARLYGFDSWGEMGDHLDVLDSLSYRPLTEQETGTEPFVAMACLNYDGHEPTPADRLESAHTMLAADPALADDSIAALATVGDHRALANALTVRPEAVNEACGPNNWPPLLYATYSRIDPDRFSDNRQLASRAADWSALETVKTLLDLEADANAGFLWRGLVPPFTALTGAFGGGESHQPWHPNRLEVARLLLEAGADPNDGQALYNNGIGGQNHDDPGHLELLAEFGLGTQQDGPWYQKLGRRLREPAELLYDDVEAAALRGRPRIMAYLLSLGLDPDRPVGRSQNTPVRIAAEHGHSDVLDVLAAAGVDVPQR